MIWWPQIIAYLKRLAGVPKEPTPTMKDKLSIDRVMQLHPKVRGTMMAFIVECEQTIKTTFRVAQGWRTFEEQDKIYEQFRDRKDNDGDGRVDESDERVTKVRGGYSYHNYGLAVDLVEMKDGKPNWNFDYAKLESIAKKYGIKWGYREWKFDKPHFHINFGLTVYQLLEMYKAGNFISGTKYVQLRS